MPSLPDAVILCGGAGLRLRTVTGDAPKSMAGVAGRPFLEVLLSQLHRHEFERAVLAVGYQGETIQAYFGARAFGMELRYSQELTPLGTGGAIRNAAGLVDSETSLIMNGDSYTDADLGKFVAEHRASGADVSLVVVETDRRDDAGYLRVDKDGRLIGFDEKHRSQHAAFANAGIYLMSHAMMTNITPGSAVSLEREVFPRWIAENRDIRVYVHPGMCVDIGTPERYQKAQDSLANVEAPGTAQEASQR